MDRWVGVSKVIESRRLAQHKRKVSSRLSWGAVLQTLQNPVLVVPLAKLGDCLAQFVQIPKAPDPEQLLFEGAEEPLDASVALGLADKGRCRGRDGAARRPRRRRRKNRTALGPLAGWARAPRTGGLVCASLTNGRRRRPTILEPAQSTSGLPHTGAKA